MNLKLIDIWWEEEKKEIFLPQIWIGCHNENISRFRFDFLILFCCSPEFYWNVFFKYWISWIFIEQNKYSTPSYPLSLVHIPTFLFLLWLPFNQMFFHSIDLNWNRIRFEIYTEKKYKHAHIDTGVAITGSIM